MSEIKPLQFHKGKHRKTCIDAPHVHCQQCDKALNMPRGFCGAGNKIILCLDCQRKQML